MPTRSTTLLVISMLAAGCPSSAPVQSLDTVDNALDGAACRHIARCFPGAMAAFAGGSVATCEAEFACFEGYALGYLVVAEARDACIEELERSECGSEFLLRTTYRGVPHVRPRDPLSSVCLGKFSTYEPSGSRAKLGERCIFNEEMPCAEGLRCRADDPVLTIAGVACGVCVTPAAVRETCMPDVACADGSFCDGEVCRAFRDEGEACEADDRCSRGRCMNGVCIDPNAVNAAFDGQGAGKDCDYLPGVTCGEDVTLACSAGTCVRRPDLGEPCSGLGAVACLVGLVCHDGRCRSGPRCTTMEGAPCGEGDPYRCAGGITCHERAGQSRCEAILVGKQAGDACNVGCRDADLLFCNDESVCEAVAPHLGEACGSRADCPGSSYCKYPTEPECSYHDSQMSCTYASCEDCGVCIERPTLNVCDSP